MRLCSVALVAFTGPIAAAHAAQPVPVSIERWVQSSSEVQAEFGEERLLDRTTFFTFDDASIDEQVTSFNMLADSITEAQAAQISSVSADAFSVEGSVGGRTQNESDLFICQSSPVSQFVYTFDLDEPMPYRITGRLFALDSGTGGGFVLVRLAAAFGGPVEFLEFAQSTENDFDQQGVLQPGRYILRIEASAYISDPFQITYEAASFAVNGTFGNPPCPADLNGDGILDNGDIGVFVTLFLAGDLAADFNSDGILDNGDIGAFVAAFLAGC